MLAMMQATLHFGFLKIQGIEVALDTFPFSLLVLATLLIAGAGYLINDIFDIETDAINKPKQCLVGTSISIKNAYNLYVAMNIVGVGIGFYLSNFIEKPNFVAIFILIATTLYVYAANLKQTTIIGNIIVSVLVACSIIIVGIFDLYPMITIDNQSFLAVVFKIILDYAFFAFMLNFLREIIKDIQDIDGDNQAGMKTLPITFGISRTMRLVFGLSIIPLILFIYYVHNYYFMNKLYYSTLYSLVFIAAPLILFTIKSFDAQSKNNFAFLSRLLKVIMFFGIFVIFIVSLEIRCNA